MMVKARPTALEIDYTNHRGERRVRRISPVFLKYIRSEFHGPDLHYIMVAVDLERNVLRSFLMSNIHSMKEVSRHPVWSYEI